MADGTLVKLDNKKVVDIKYYSKKIKKQRVHF